MVEYATTHLHPTELNSSMTEPTIAAIDPDTAPASTPPSTRLLILASDDAAACLDDVCADQEDPQ